MYVAAIEIPNVVSPGALWRFVKIPFTTLHVVKGKNYITHRTQAYLLTPNALFLPKLEHPVRFIHRLGHVTFGFEGHEKTAGELVTVLQPVKVTRVVNPGLDTL